ncbi:MAG: 16S rRNA (uracil(1498)-N(3))-methyltransferase [Lentisphaerae bacterium]|nr:16S rRNA (uracil(1498)-N(3))-methyltransferase [Lentisphaerota bacterium]
MNRILFTAAEVDSDGGVTLSDRRAQHICRVLKPAPGQLLRVGILDGPTGSAEVIDCTADRVQLRCTFSAVAPAPSPDLGVMLALPRPKVLKRLWAPLASLGVTQIVLTNAAKVERNYFDTHWLQEAHYRPRLIEGLEQAGLTRVPDVTVCRQLKPFVEDELEHRFPSTLRLLAHPHAARRIRDVTRAPAEGVLLAIGPEGGWIPFELELLERQHFVAISTGTDPLRSDVACIALIAVVRELAAGPPIHSPGR